jgi:hypothetical protein
MLPAEGRERLARYAKGDQPDPLPGFWMASDLSRFSR